MDFFRIVELLFAGGVGGTLIALAQYIRARGQNRNEAIAQQNIADAQQRDYLLKVQELTNADERQLREALAQMWSETRQQLRVEQQARMDLDSRLTETQRQLTIITGERDVLRLEQAHTQADLDQTRAELSRTRTDLDEAHAKIRHLEGEIAQLRARQNQKEHAS